MNDYTRENRRLEVAATVRLARKNKAILVLLSLVFWPLAWWYVGGCGLALLGIGAGLLLALISVGVGNSFGLIFGGVAAIGGLVLGWLAIDRARSIIND